MRASLCDKCGSVKCYKIKSRKQFRCKECFCTFNLTSNTLFHSHKLNYKSLLLVIMLFANSVKGISALKLSRDLGIAYKSAWVLAHKLRESLLDDKHKDKFKGIVEMDGVYVNTYIRPKNHKHKPKLW